MSSSLDGRHVVLTRPVGRSFDLRKRLESLGAVVNEVPLLDVVSAPDGGASIREGARQLSEGDWIALTSASAVEGLMNALAFERLVGFRLAAVGEATATALRAVGLTPALVGEVALRWRSSLGIPREPMSRSCSHSPPSPFRIWRRAFVRPDSTPWSPLPMPPLSENSAKQSAGT